MYDVVIIGAGIIGASVARELAKYDLKIMVLEKENDVANGTTKANSALIHAGFDPEHGTLMAEMNVKGNAMFGEICKELDVPFRRNGALVLAFDDKDMKVIQHLYENGVANGVPNLQILSAKEVVEVEPNINKEVTGALYAPTAGIIGPWEYTIALMENAVVNGVDLQLNSKVTNIEKLREGYEITINDSKKIETKYIINAAGVYADQIHNMIAEPAYKITPNKGQYYIMDKSQGSLVDKTIFQCPDETGKGVVVTPTVHGNLLVGPDSRAVESKEDVSTTAERLAYCRGKAAKSVASINFRESIRNFAGLRATADRPDFIIEEVEEAKGFIDLAGIKSPGLSSAPAIGVKALELLEKSGCNLQLKESFIAERKQVVFMELSSAQKSRVIKDNPAYGRIICRCENITEGEIIDSIHRPVGARTVDGVKKRCRPGMGRCQGGFCGPRVQEILARELNKPLEEILLDKNGSYILTGQTKK